MPRTYKKRRVARFPEGGPGFDANACVTADCQNFGNPSISNEGQDELYMLVGLGTDSEGPLLGFQCRACKRTGEQYSNLAIGEEKARYMKALTRGLLGSCRTDGCTGNGLDVTTSPDQYSKFSYTAIGSPRFRCADCRKTFSALPMKLGAVSIELNILHDAMVKPAMTPIPGPLRPGFRAIALGFRAPRLPPPLPSVWRRTALDRL